MRFEFALNINEMLPIALMPLECDIDDMVGNVCIDTGATISILYMSELLLEALYPNYQKTGKSIKITSADGGEKSIEIYKIDDFILTDNIGNRLHILDFLFVLMDNKIAGIDILLSACAFYNSRISFYFRGSKKSNNQTRIFSVDTIGQRCLLTMKTRHNGNGTVNGFPALSVDVDDRVIEKV